MSKKRCLAKISHVIAPAEFGGLEQVVINLVSGLAGRGVEVDLTAIVDREADKHPFVMSARDARIDLTTLVIHGRKYWQEVGLLRRNFRRSGSRVVHTHGSRVDVLAGWAAHREGVPWVSTVHGFTGGDLKNQLYERVQVARLRRADRVVAVSDDLGNQLRERGVGPGLRVIPNARPRLPVAPPAHARQRLGLPQEGFLVGWVGRMTGEKGLDLFLTSLRDSAMPSDVQAVIVGDGPMREELQARTDQWGLTSRIRWLGVVSNAGPLVSAFDLVVCSSRTEGTPMVLLEALAAEVPIVSTSVGGVPDLLGPEGGILVPAGDSAAIARAIAKVYGDPAGAKQRAVAFARRRASRDVFEHWLDSYTALYQELQSDPRSVGVST